MNTYLDTPPYREAFLERLRYGVERRIQRQFLRLRVDSRVEDMTDTVAIRLTADLLGEKSNHTILRTPKTWWDHFKLECFPAWALALWPVDYNCYDIRFDVLYPDYKFQLPDERHEIRLFVSNSPTP